MGWLLIIESGTGWRRYRTAVYRRGYSIYVGLEYARYIVRVQNNKRLKKENTLLNMDKTKRWWEREQHRQKKKTDAASRMGPECNN